MVKKKKAEKNGNLFIFIGILIFAFQGAKDFVNLFFSSLNISPASGTAFGLGVILMLYGLIIEVNK